MRDNISSMMNLIRQKYFIYSVSIVISLCLSFILVYQSPVFSLDGVFYLRTAETYLAQGWRVAAGQCAWPFFSLSIAWVSQLTGLSLLHATYLLSMCFSTILVLVFIALMDELGLSKKYLWVAAFVILNFQQFNVLRYQILRDHGFWALYLLSVLYLVKFSKSLSWKDAICWSISMLLAMLYRLEGSAFLLIIPFVVWFFNYSWRQRFYAFFKLNLVNLFVMAVVLFMVLYLRYFFDTQAQYFLKDYSWRLHTIFILGKKLFVVRQGLLGKALWTQDGAALFVNGVIGAYIYNISTAINFGYLIPAVYGMYKRLLCASLSSKRVLWGYIALNVVITAAFYFHRLFLSTRYAMPLILVVLCYVPFGLIALYQKWSQRPKGFSLHGWLFPFVCILLFAMTVGSVYHFGSKKYFLYDAGMWLCYNTPSSAVIYTNSPRIAWFAKRHSNANKWRKMKKFDKNMLFNKKLDEYDYLVFVINNRESNVQVELQKKLKMNPFQVFRDKDNSVFIYKFQKNKGERN